jgi:hypothetical protein
MTCVIWGLCRWSETWLLVWSVAAAVTTGISGVYYVWDGMRQMSASPTSAASPGQEQGRG